MTRSAAAAGKEQGDAARKPGRPRSTDFCLSIRAAALELLVERGFSEVTM